MPVDVNPFGFCPKCGAEGRTRERRLNGNDTCENGHTYPSKTSMGAGLALCPCCGRPAHYRAQGGEPVAHYVSCVANCVKTFAHLSRESAAYQWNTRISLEATCR